MDSPNSNLSPRNKLLQHSSSHLRWLQGAEGREFSEWLSDIRLKENKKLMESDTQAEMFRAQGSVGIIDLILSLEEDLLQYEHDVRDKKVQPFKEVVNAG